MSRVAKNPVIIPSGVEINIDQKSISVTGTKGKSEFLFPLSVSAVHVDEMVTISYDEASQESTALAGTTRSLINNMVIGVSEGFVRKLEINGVGYRVKVNGDSLELSFENFLLCLERKLLLDTLVLRLDIQLFSNKVLVAFQDVDLHAVKVWTFLITQPAEEDMYVFKI